MEYLIHLGILICIYAILGLSLNLVVGYTGLLSVAQAAFYGIGAYTSALLLLDAGWNFFFALIAGMIAAGVGAFLFGFLLCKVNGDYYATASLCLGLISYSVFFY